ncbi:tetratricopeptide repeat protein [Spirosoma taeanense]|uniref:Tetratricopeptide repeat protein n=1 Tax=Spirosoma taeanense TaxID=2735870 RepID=A0A6M5Y6S1_9BACT|nr:tetratricopeptide repeat protein [Spirosoma taeanense]QJW90087.1 tetratricopeptide repeat protein [Spirosoma taeanense]
MAKRAKTTMVAGLYRLGSILFANTNRAKSITKANSKLDRLKERLSQLRSIVISTVLIIVICVIVHMIWREVNKNYIIFDSIEVPEELVTQGYTGTVVARYLIDEINRIKYVAEDSVKYTLNPRLDIVTIGVYNDIPDLNFEVSETKISFSSIINFFRIYFNKERLNVSGNILIKDKNVEIICRYKSETFQAKVSVDSVRIGINLVALELFKKLKPITIANYYYAKNNFAEGKRFLLDNLPYLETGDRSEAYLILGLIENSKLPRDTTKSRVYFNKAIQENSQNAAAYNNLGLLMRENKQYILAESCFKNAINANPKSASAYVNFGLLRLSKLNHKDSLMAEEYFNSAIAQNPNYSSYAYINLGLLKKYQGDSDTAEKLFQTAIDVAPRQVDGYINLGLLKRDEGRLVEAEELYTQAIKLEPKNYFTHNILGILKRDQGIIAEADSFFRVALKLEPKRPAYAYNNMGHIRRDMMQNVTVDSMYHLSNRANPKAPNSAAYLGIMAEGRGNQSLAKYWYNKAIKVDSSGVNAYVYKGFLELDRHNYISAEQELKKSIKLNPNFVDALICLSLLEIAKGKVDRANLLHRRAINISPTNSAFAYNSIGNLRRDQKRFPEAEKMYRITIQINNKYISAFNNLARIKELQNKLEEAIIFYNKALAINPKDLEARAGLKRIIRR